MVHKILFYKYQGAGNDFILIDNRNGDFDPNNRDVITKMCDRRFGIGADGLMLLNDNKNLPDSLDFEMLYFNADGREGTMCGNGGRCLVAFARDLNIIDTNTVFLAVDGQHDATISGGQVKLGMIDVDHVTRDGEAYVLNTGSPHYIKFVNDLQNLDVYSEGYNIRNSEPYRKNGINVNFVEKEADGYFCRTFERGVENETFACGTGVTAAAMAIAIHENRSGRVQIPIRVLGGQLEISFEKEGNTFRNVYLEGPAHFVFKGEIDPNNL